MLRRQFVASGLLALAGLRSGVTTAMAQSNRPPDPQALDALRPGMPVSRVADAVGAAWRELAPHKGGTVDVLENSHGIIVRIDREGRVGAISYDHRFSGTIDGLWMGMSLKSAQAAMPDLKVGADLASMPGVRIGNRSFPDGSQLQVTFTLETINRMSLAIPGAAYPAPTAPPYPAASGAAAAPFIDVNFKLAVLSSLLDAKAIDLGTPQQLAAHALGRPVDLDDEGYALIPQARDYLARYPLTEDLLAAVERLEFDGGATIYPYVQYFWDGEDDTFTIGDIAGIEKCPNLTELRIISMIDGIDARQLVPLRRLARLSCDTGVTHLEALLDLPSLKEIRMMSNSLYAEVSAAGHSTRRVFDTLKSRGVRVWVHWVSHTGPGHPPPFE
ncbi:MULTISPECIES: hypothetical protein [unclassified Bradyrhizobium]|uniref:DUF7256 domain-containing protein n=1 Tax=unclassified Bradyrhizobium TaxID=2631580 RepID=UPI0020139C42|nr:MULTISPECIES: hypothetical protein [unclassified Bradyrhizobium]